MRYLRNREFARQLLLSLLLWALAVALCLLCFPGQRGCAVISGALGLAFTALWTGFTVRRYRKLEELASAADQLLHGGRPLNLKEYQEGELAILANELEKLISRLQEQSDRLQREQRYLCDSLADISHQLRTPLTSLNLLLARLPGERDEGERRRRIYEAGQLQERISWLVEALLKIARIDAGTAVFTKERVDAGRLVRAALEPFGIPMEIRSQRAELELEEEAAFEGDPEWSTQALSNIIKNCLEHAGEGGTLRIQARENSLYTEFIIEDDGPGIDPEDLPHLFERFYQGKQSFGTGMGIGLSLARMIVNAQNGTVKAGNRPEGGAQFTLRFYKGVV